MLHGWRRGSGTASTRRVARARCGKETSVSSDPCPHVVIVGGGFGGIAAARALRDAPVRVTVLDRRNHYLFQPLLYQVATSELAPGEIATPIRQLLRHQRNASVALLEVTGIDPAARRVLVACSGD